MTNVGPIIELRLLGRKPHGMRFTGELMVCAICGDVKKSDANTLSDWEWFGATDLPGWGLYYCTKHKLPEKMAHFQQATIKEAQRFKNEAERRKALGLP